MQHTLTRTASLPERSSSAHSAATALPALRRPPDSCETLVPLLCIFWFVFVSMSPLPPARANKSDNKGLISADRNNKATLLLTIPRCTSKSYTNDLSPLKMTLLSAGKHPRPFRQEHRCRPAMVQRRHKDALFVSIYLV
ncbi:AHL_G0036750.mRNA.1.CDS.1 [Saccharomyces cerevisiae]|nr:AMP_1a_G0036780.mRNA.1.CDS.1 [Saccharomyces cerevisiae]CAI4621929.1 BHH_G0036480.mRNA.1.CDS.1 [Saccharomyces cerevisiae]CAI4623060.1 CNB_1a_G0036660.mRNA.1.CDS.1 [Saccharomyces cerevisiae]CAI4623682.1 CPG_1a_G0036650.mRNA.1.CDS.1 [Saccharomyces cerevisiae]CAI4628178.1 BDH_1b_G0036860.mRNA.1.CDS.1 [Saccharomyces cerevisiae]